MKHLQRSVAFTYGFFLLCFACIWLSGFLAARAVPLTYFQFFSSLGPSGPQIGHAVLGIALYLIPIVVFILVGTLGALRLVKPRARNSLVTATFAGAVLGYFASLASTASEPSLPAVLSPLLQAQWWALPSILAPVVGIGAAWAIARTTAPAHAGA